MFPIREVLPIREYFIRNDGTLWKDEECKEEMQLFRKLKHAPENDIYAEDYDPYMYCFLQPKPYAMHQAMKRFLHNPLPKHRIKNYRFDRVDHINCTNKTDNRMENLRFSNPHLNSLNRLLVEDVKFDTNTTSWSAGFRSTCRGLNEYKTKKYKTFHECWKAYKTLRKNVHDLWYQYYLTA